MQRGLPMVIVLWNCNFSLLPRIASILDHFIPHVVPFCLLLLTTNNATGTRSAFRRGTTGPFSGGGSNLPSLNVTPRGRSKRGRFTRVIGSFNRADVGSGKLSANRRTGTFTLKGIHSTLDRRIGRRMRS